MVWNLHKRPADAKAQVEAFLDDLQPWLQPVEPEALGVLLKRLSLHYPMPQMTDTERRHFWLDYRRDLRHLPLDVIEHGCDLWRRDPGRKYFPRPCELLVLCEWKLQSRQNDSRNLEQWLEDEADE